MQTENPNDAGWVSDDGLIAISLAHVVFIRWTGNVSVYVQFTGEDPHGFAVFELNFQNFEALRNKFMHYLSKR